MLPQSRRTAARLARVAAIGTIVVFSGLLALARGVPEAWAESTGASQRLFMLSFFVRTFEMHIGLVLLVPLAVLLVLRKWRFAALAAPALIWTLSPLALSFLRPAPARLSQPLRVMTANLLVGHAKVDALVKEVERFSPDVLFLQEYTPAKAEALVRRIGAAYPHRAEAMRDHAFGEAIYSKIPFESEPELYPHQSIRPTRGLEDREGTEVGIWDAQIRAVILFEGKPIVLQNVHYAPPIRAPYLGEQRIMTNWLCEWVRRETRPVIVAGDFNSAPASTNLCALRQAGLTNSRGASSGWAGTWPARGWASLLSVPIDHILVRGLECEFAGPGQEIDSDHLPWTAVVGTR